jgi:hypothetical protein
LDTWIGGYGDDISVRSLLTLSLLLALALSCPAQTFNTLNADVVVHMDTSSAGTAFTSTIGNAGVSVASGSTATWATVPTTCSGTGSPTFEVGANQSVANLGAVQINGGGTLYPAGSLIYNTIGHQDGCTISNAQLNLGGTIASSTPIHWLEAITITATLPVNGTSGDFDHVIMWNNTGYASVGQFVSGETGGTYCTSMPSGTWGIRIEASQPTTNHAPCISVPAPTSATPSVTYWVSQTWTVGSPYKHTLYVYTQDGTQVPCSTSYGGGTATGSCNSDGGVSVTEASGPTTGTQFITIGNNEIGYNNGTVTYFGDIFICGSTCSTPYFWTQNSTVDPWVGVIAPPRGSDWSIDGVVGGIPSGSWSQCVTTACSAVTSAGTSVTTTQINSALSSAPNDTYVLLPTGTLTNVTTCPTLIGLSNVVLRGAGAGASGTIIEPTSECFDIYNSNSPLTYSGNASNLTTWTPGGGVGGANPFTTTNFYPQGTNSIILSSVSNLLVGGEILLDQIDPTIDYGGLLVSQLDSGGTAVSPGVAGPWSSLGNSVNAARGTCHGGSPCYSQLQEVTVTSCNGTTTIGASCSGSNVVVVFSPGLDMPNWGYDYAGNALTTSAWWPSASSQYVGIENLQINMANCSGCIAIHEVIANNTWVKGVAIINGNPSNSGLIKVEVGHHFTVENSYLFGGITGTAGVYGIELDACSDCLALNNIVHGITTPFISNSSTLNTTWAYNYAINGFYTSGLLYNIPASGCHGSGVAKDLIEGNITNGATQDTIHGTCNLESYFRNNFWGQYPACADSSSYSGAYGTCTQNMTPMNDSVFHRFSSFIGNVLGTSGIQTVYSTTNFETGSGPYAIYQYGGQTVTGPDANTQLTAILWGGSDVVTGFTSPRFNCNEVGEGTAIQSLALSQFRLYSNCPSSDTLPNSFIYSSQPSFLSVASKPWPLIGPDVTGGNLILCSSGTYSGAVVNNVSLCTGGTGSTYGGGHANSNPAMDCFFAMGGNPYGTNGVLTGFTHSNCAYLTDNSGASQGVSKLGKTVNKGKVIIE